MVDIDEMAHSPEEVAVRATLCLALAMRGLLEGDAGSEDEAEADTMRDQLQVGLERESRLWTALQDDERDLLQTPVGTAKQAVAEEFIWAAEAGQVLLWALERRELPAHDEQEHPFKVAKSIGVISNVGGIPTNWLLLRSPRLRSLAEICELQRCLTAIRSRLDLYAEDPEAAVDFEAFASRLGVHSELPQIAGDLAIENQAILHADEGSVANAMAVASERQAGIDWLVGQPIIP